MWKSTSASSEWIAHNRGRFSLSHSVVSNSLRSHGLQHARPPCPSPTLRVYSNSCPLSRWCHPTISSCCHLLLPPSVFPSIKVFSNESVLCIRWPKYWSFSFSISPSNEYSGPVSFRMDWLDPLSVQGTLKSLLQHHSSKASILWHSAFFIVQLSHPYLTTGETIAFTRQTFVGKVMSLFSNMLSRLVISFLPRRGRLGCSFRGSFLGCLCPIIFIFGPGVGTPLSQKGFQLASSLSFCLSSRLRVFSAHVSGQEIHKNVPSVNAPAGIPSASVRRRPAAAAQPGACIAPTSKWYNKNNMSMIPCLRKC